MLGVQKVLPAGIVFAVAAGVAVEEAPTEEQGFCPFADVAIAVNEVTGFELAIVPKLSLVYSQTAVGRAVKATP